MIAVHNLWDEATAVATTNVITSEPITTLFNRGYCSLLVVVTGATPSLDITFTVSKSQNGTYYTPVDGNGTDLGIIYESLAATAWIQFSPAIAPWIKIVITGTATNGANTEVKAYLMWQEETEAM